MGLLHHHNAILNPSAMGSAAESARGGAQEQQRAQKASQFAQDAAAAALSSTIYTTVFYPLHRVKVLLQTQEAHPDIQAGRVKRYNFTGSFPRIIREQGVASLWRGNLPYMCRHVPSTTLSFALKDALQRHVFPQYDPTSQHAQFVGTRLAAGGLAGIMALGVVYPMDFATIRMAANLGPQDPGMLQTLQSSSRRGGLATLYRGYPVSATAIGAYKALYFGLYDVAKEYLMPGSPEYKAAHQRQAAARQQHQHQLHQQHMAQASSAQAGAQGPGQGASLHPAPADWAAAHVAPAGPAATPTLAGEARRLLWSWLVASGVVCVASTATYPLDVIRKRLVVDTAQPVRQFHGFADCVRKIAAREGIRGFYRFYGVDMLLRFGGGVLLVMYDELRASMAGQKAGSTDDSSSSTISGGADMT